MLLRLAHPGDLPALLALVRRAVPLMRAEGNLQWDDDYPNRQVFRDDIARGELWVAELSVAEPRLAEPKAAEPTPAGPTAAEISAAEPAGQNAILAGVAAITTDQSPEYAHVGWDLNEPAIVVHRLAVDPACRGAGVATALMRHAETVARDRGIAVLRIDTNSRNAGTQRLFPKLGYTFAGQIELAFRPGLHFLCYEKRLQPTQPVSN